MKKFLQISVIPVIITLFLSSFYNVAGAQKLIFVYGHGLGAVPLDKSSSTRYTGGFGAEAGLGIGAKSTFFVASLGYTSFSGKDTFKTESYIPVKIGIREYLPMKIIFVDANIGVGFVNNSTPTKQTPNPSGSRFAADLGAGVKLGGFELGLNFDVFKEPNPDGWAGWMVFKAGFRIGL